MPGGNNKLCGAINRMLENGQWKRLPLKQSTLLEGGETRWINNEI